ncbi:iron transport protein [Penaeus vannamei]|uniref:Iron transport protein n=1 Tax=Penaeus vannamei TaxID=6689 RepID=A0A423SUR3_PENVA|nr:iron transport protein [Penaeus vannamei]
MARKHPCHGDKISPQHPPTAFAFRRAVAEADFAGSLQRQLERKMVVPKALHFDKIFQKRLMLFLVLMICQQGYASFIKVRPNTLREFQFLKCQGEFNKAQYVSLSHVCEDCHNLYRQPEILTECKANCFQNTLFPTCVSLLMLDRHEDDLNKKVALISGQEL